MNSNKGRIVSPVVAWGILIVILAGVCWAIKGQMASEKTVTTESPVATKSTPSTSPSSSAASVAPITDEGVTWLAEAQKLDDLGLLTLTGGLTAANNPLTYYRVGTDNGKDIIIATYPVEEMGMTYPVIQFLKNSDSSYSVMTKYSEASYSKNKNEYGYTKPTAKVTGTSDKTYKSVAVRSTDKANEYTVNGVKYTSFDGSGWFSTEKDDIVKTHKSTVSKMADTAYGTLYKSTATPESSHYGGLYMSDQYILETFSHTISYYELATKISTDDGVPQITWNDGTKNTYTYRTDGSLGCGLGYGILYLKDNYDKDLKAAGKTASGETIYEFTDKNHKIIKPIFDALVSTNTGQVGADPVPTLDEYVASHSLFVYKDKLNHTVVYSGGKYQIAAECGKPVIYLYPTEKTDVTVKVGAKVTVSEPNYGDGWKVNAAPNGQLTNSDGKVYNSLFWEGLGKGIYPDITSGFVVAQKDVEATMRQHLTQLGLNTQESADFMEFWLPKMPKTPFVRLSWFGTRDMDRLAPLMVQPKPDTSIRIFLDFAGLDKKIDLPEQKLTSIPRSGFTLIEWGGLLVK